MKDEKGLAVMIGVGEPMGMGKGMGKQGKIVPVPLSALATNDGNENVEPAQGDSVDFNVKGVIESIADGKAMVKVTSINDQELPDMGEEKEVEKEETMDEEGQIRNMAQKEDEENYASV